MNELRLRGEEIRCLWLRGVEAEGDAVLSAGREELPELVCGEVDAFLEDVHVRDV